MGRGWIILLAMAAAGCARSAGVVFPPVTPPIVWPGAPEAARIAYVGEIRTRADLKPGVDPLAGLGDAMFGEKSDQALVTPYAVATDGADRVFVADSAARVVHVFNLASRDYAQWRPGDKPFGQPVGLAWDASGKRLLVADSVAGTIEVFDTDGKWAGSFAGGLAQRPTGIAIDANRGRIFIADVAAHQVVIVSPDGALLARLGQRGSGLGEFNFPTAVAVDSVGRLYVSDTLNFRVQQFSADFKPLRQIGAKGDMPGYFSQPKGIAIDGDDHLYVVDAQFEAVQIFDADGRLLLGFGEEGRGPGEFWLPSGIAIDVHDRIWIADGYNRRIQVFDYLKEGRK